MGWGKAPSSSSSNLMVRALGRAQVLGESNFCVCALAVEKVCSNYRRLHILVNEVRVAVVSFHYHVTSM